MAALERIFDKHKPDIVFHAAAYKHVPLLEECIHEATLNNILGTMNITKMSLKYNVQKFVNISTDKAVNPSSVMGVTKRIGELYCQNIPKKSSQSFISVRFGNVLGSSGSLINIFKEQISNGGPLTITHPETTRFFMTIREAVHLIISAVYSNSNNDIFVLDMGEPIKITYIAEKMIELSGHSQNDLKVDYIGLRPGEKLHEDLFYEYEKPLNLVTNKIFKCKPTFIDWPSFSKQVQILIDECNNYSENKILSILKKLVPEYMLNIERVRGIK
jgi:FlaA1/EpsC-like NDP-sugar epimerase